MNSPAQSEGKRFISLKWRALALTSSLLVIVFTLFMVAGRYASEAELEEQGKQRTQRYVEQLQSLLDMKAERMLMLAQGLINFEGVAAAIRSGDSDRISASLDAFWGRLEQATAARSLVIFSPQDEILLWQGEPSIPPDLWKPFSRIERIASRSVVSLSVRCMAWPAWSSLAGVVAWW